jgi:hypothetical protein
MSKDLKNKCEDCYDYDTFLKCCNNPDSDLYCHSFEGDRNACVEFVERGEYRRTSHKDPKLDDIVCAQCAHYHFSEELCDNEYSDHYQHRIRPMHPYCKWCFPTMTQKDDAYMFCEDCGAYVRYGGYCGDRMSNHFLFRLGRKHPACDTFGFLERDRNSPK